MKRIGTYRCINRECPERGLQFESEVPAFEPGEPILDAVRCPACDEIADIRAVKLQEETGR